MTIVVIQETHHMYPNSLLRTTNLEVMFVLTSFSQEVFFNFIQKVSFVDGLSKLLTFQMESFKIVTRGVRAWNEDGFSVLSGYITLLCHYVCLFPACCALHVVPPLLLTTTHTFISTEYNMGLMLWIMIALSFCSTCIFAQFQLLSLRADFHWPGITILRQVLKTTGLKRFEPVR